MICQAIKKNGQACSYQGIHNGYCGIHKDQGIAGGSSPGVCCQVASTVTTTAASTAASTAAASTTVVALETCPICQDDIKPGDLHMTNCGHFYHKECFIGMICRQRKCCICREPILAIPATSGYKKLLDTETKVIHKDLYEQFKNLSISFSKKQMKYNQLQRHILDLQRESRLLENQMTTNDITKGQEIVADIEQLEILRKDLSLSKPKKNVQQFLLWHHI